MLLVILSPGPFSGLISPELSDQFQQKSTVDETGFDQDAIAHFWENQHNLPQSGHVQIRPGEGVPEFISKY